MKRNYISPKQILIELDLEMCQMLANSDLSGQGGTGGTGIPTNSENSVDIGGETESFDVKKSSWIEW